MIAENTGRIIIFRYIPVNSYSVAAAKQFQLTDKMDFIVLCSDFIFLDQEPIFSRGINCSLHICDPPRDFRE